MSLVTIYSKPGCHLCDRAKEVIKRCPVEFEIVDISQNAELLARYGYDIPVILLDGVEIARHFVREQQVLELLREENIMNVKLLALIATIAVTGLYFAHAADEPKAKTDPRLDKIIEQNEQILKNQADIKQQLEKLSQEILQVRRRSS